MRGRFIDRQAVRVALEPLESRWLLSAAGLPVDDAGPVATDSAWIEAPPAPTGVTAMDLNAMIAAGEASVATSAFDIGSVANLFDGDVGTLWRSQSINPAEVTVTFTQPRTLEAFRTYFSNAGGDPSHRWRVEAALSAADLDSRTGSYTELVPWTDTPSDVDSDVMLGEPAVAQVVRLTAERLTGDDFVHVREWTLYGGEAVATLSVTPAQSALEVGQMRLLAAEHVDAQGQATDVTALSTWTSSDPSIAAVDATGGVTAMSVGSCTITAEYGSLTAEAEVVVLAEATVGRLDINAMVDQGLATVTSNAPGSPDPFTRIFDADSGSLWRSDFVNPAAVTVAFDAAQTLYGFSVIGSHAGGDPAYRWRVESAMSRAELDTQTGSYAELVPWTTTPSDVASQVDLPLPEAAAVVRLWIERLTGDDLVHLNDWALLGTTSLVDLRIEPADATVEQYSSVDFSAMAVAASGLESDATGAAAWSTSDPTIATVDDAGVVTALAPGICQVVAAYGELTAEATVTVTPYQLAPADLNVTYIERTPRYDYDAAKNRPEPGDLVTFNGHVVNWSNHTDYAAYRWSIDGAVVAEGVLRELLPDEQRVLALPWVWEEGRHTVTLAIDPLNQVEETSERNNVVTVHSDALLVGFWVEQAVYDYFHEHQPDLGIGANSWEDWAQRQIDWWNGMNAQAIHPISPAGVLDRVALDQVIVVPDGALPLNGGLPSNHPDTRDKTVDYMWGFPRTSVTSGFYDDTTGLGSNPFYREWSLIHELGHARYLIDHYGFDIHEGSVDVTEGGMRIVDTDYLPQIRWGVVHYNQYGGIMSGPYDGWSPAEAAALNLIAGQRASAGNYNAPGNIGAFLEDLPEHNHLRFVDEAGEPLVGAEVSLYRAVGQAGVWYGKYIDDAADLTFTTDDDGCAHLPRNPFTDGLIQHTYGVANGVAVLRIEHAGDVWFRVIELPTFNLAYWQGQTTDAGYEMMLPAPGSEPDLRVTGFGQRIAAGDTTPDPADHTSFGAIAIGEAVRRNFPMHNDGASLLTVTRVELSGPDADQFALERAGTQGINRAAMSPFVLTYQPTRAGTHAAAITVRSDDPDTPAYRFDVAGSAAPPPTTVRATHVGYGFGQTANTLAVDVTPLPPGQPAGPEHVVTWPRGITELAIDLGDPSSPISAGDLVLRIGQAGDPATWPAAPAPVIGPMLDGLGADGGSRTWLSWPNDAIADTWLQLTILSDAHGGSLGLADDHVVYFGHLAGDSDGNGLVDADDLTPLTAGMHDRLDPAARTDPYDHDRDGRVNARDLLIVRANLGASLAMLDAPAAADPVVGTAASDQPAVRPPAAAVASNSAAAAPEVELLADGSVDALQAAALRRALLVDARSVGGSTIDAWEPLAPDDADDEAIDLLLARLQRR